jgi:hypothetical protein
MQQYREMRQLRAPSATILGAPFFMHSIEIYVSMICNYSSIKQVNFPNSSDHVERKLIVFIFYLYEARTQYQEGMY